MKLKSAKSCFVSQFQDDIPENIGSPQDVWRVSASWVLDLQDYNEWMAEEDYEVDDNGKKKIHKLRLSVDEIIPLEDKRTTKGASSGSGAANKQSKRKRSPSPTVKGGAKRKR